MMMFLSTMYYAYLAYRLAKKPGAPMCARCHRASAYRTCSLSLS